jgi:hypothetical protein
VEDASHATDSLLPTLPGKLADQQQALLIMAEISKR